MTAEEISKAREYLSCGFDKKRSAEELTDETVISICKSMERNTQKIIDMWRRGVDEHGSL